MLRHVKFRFIDATSRLSAMATSNTRVATKSDLCNIVVDLVDTQPVPWRGGHFRALPHNHIRFDTRHSHGEDAGCQTGSRCEQTFV